MAAALRRAGVSGLHDELRPGHLRPISDERVARLKLYCSAHCLILVPSTFTRNRMYDF
jgi:hypothetical protein